MRGQSIAHLDDNRQMTSYATAALRIDYATVSPGRVDLAPSDEHRLCVHAGPPARGSCAHQRHLFTRGDINIFPAGHGSSWTDDDPASTVILSFSPTLLRRAAQDTGFDPDRAGLDLRHQLRDPQIEHVVWALDAEHRAGCPNGPLYTDSLGMALAIHLLGRYAATPIVRSVAAGLSPAQRRRLTDYIESHLDQPLTLTHLATVADLSTSHLKTLFKRSMGWPVHEYIVRRRVERARTLFTDGDLPASQIALEAGFAHQSHMARCMRRVLGVMPSEIVRRNMPHRPSGVS